MAVLPRNVRLKHLDITGLADAGEYRRPARTIRKRFVRDDHAAHGGSLEHQLAQAYERASANVGLRDPEVAEGGPGIYLQVEGLAGKTLEKLELRSKHIMLANLHVTPEGTETAALFIPDEARPELERRIGEYKESGGQNRPNATHDRFEPLERITYEDLAPLWTSPKQMPEGDAWFEVWCYRKSLRAVVNVIEKLRMHKSNERLSFPDFVVLFVYTNVQALRRLVWNCGGGVFQLRSGMDNPHLFTRSGPQAQHAWVENARGRLIAPLLNAPAVTLLDLGITRAHPLIEPFIVARHADAFDPNWGPDDHDRNGHGTNMAGCALYGDLTFAMADDAPIKVHHFLESVKILPPEGANAPNSYGVVTQSAVSIAELMAQRSRIFCCAVTSDAHDASRPSTWSAAIDQICSGSMEADEGEEAIDKPKRMVMLATGNIAGHEGRQTDADLIRHPIEDPSQSWNAVCVGGFTDRTDITDAGYENYTTVATAGSRSPFSRSSISWDDASTPIKPEVVFEAGNVALNEKTNECIEGLESLSVLTTGKDLVARPLVEFNMTSAAVAQAARMAAIISASDETFWPETVRGLMIHSADWRPPMKQSIDRANRRAERVALIRQFGFGVPSLERALGSTRNDIALIAQNAIRPFRRKRIEVENKPPRHSIITDEIHYYPLPWPTEALREIYAQTVRLKITLSYFIEPNPGAAGSKYVRTYQSYGLRFDLKRRNEDKEAFRSFINELDKSDDEDNNETDLPTRQPDDGWILGPNSRSAGSIHCDVWEGSAANLASRDEIAVYPITGWWKTRTSEKRYNDHARYCLIVSLDARETDIDIYTPIATSLNIENIVEIDTA
jgi:hypothetical protein